MSNVTNLSPEIISQLQRIRRANNGVRGCSEILTEHSVNKESVHIRPGAVIVLTAQQELGLLYVIEATAQMVDDLFYDLEKQGVEWSEEHMPEVRKEAEEYIAREKTWADASNQ